MDEFSLINRFFKQAVREADLGVGDDAALIRVTEGHQLAISTDMLLEGRHFFSDVDPYTLGHKVLAVNLSDMAAMGARPRFATLAIGLPKADIAWLKAFSLGFFELAERYNVELIGGDTTRSAEHTFSVTIMGEVPHGQALRRDGAKAGDNIWVSGHIGTAALALLGLKRPGSFSDEIMESIRSALETPIPQIELGLGLRSLASACMDISDGLIGDLPHILQASGGGAVICWEMIPCHSALKAWLDGDKEASKRHALQALLAGGDDYQLLFTAPPECDEQIRSLSETLGVTLTFIGKIRAAPGVFVISNDGSLLEPHYLPNSGFNHFADIK
ncbi:MAG: thiamine-phosphate kinase [Pseudomonadota bacterium]